MINVNYNINNGLSSATAEEQGEFNINKRAKKSVMLSKIVGKINKLSKLTIIDLFAGCGGLLSGFRVISLLSIHIKTTGVDFYE